MEKNIQPTTISTHQNASETIASLKEIPITLAAIQSTLKGLERSFSSSSANAGIDSKQNSEMFAFFRSAFESLNAILPIVSKALEDLKHTQEHQKKQLEQKASSVQMGESTQQLKVLVQQVKELKAQQQASQHESLLSRITRNWTSQAFECLELATSVTRTELRNLNQRQVWITLTILSVTFLLGFAAARRLMP